MHLLLKYLFEAIIHSSLVGINISAKSFVIDCENIGAIFLYWYLSSILIFSLSNICSYGSVKSFFNIGKSRSLIKNSTSGIVRSFNNSSNIFLYTLLFVSPSYVGN